MSEVIVTIVNLNHVNMSDTFRLKAVTTEECRQMITSYIADNHLENSMDKIKSVIDYFRLIDLENLIENAVYQEIRDAFKTAPKSLELNEFFDMDDMNLLLILDGIIPGINESSLRDEMQEAYNGPELQEVILSESACMTAIVYTDGKSHRYLMTIVKLSIEE